MSFGGYPSWPRAILHVDGDSFFAACEQAVNPELRGKVVITGKERGIVSAASVEAKKLGIKRGVSLWDVKKICPDAIILPSDYETYSLFSKRMFDILRRYTSDVEEYSIDEAFADISGLRRPLRAPYKEIGRRIKHDIETELGINVTVGISLSKVLAKVATRHGKPNGLVTISGSRIKDYLKGFEIDKVWGIGPNTTAHLNRLGIYTALDFVSKSFEYIQKAVTKPHQEIWQELNGHQIYEVHTELKTAYQSISKTKTFTPPSRDKEFVYSQLVRNLENACLKARRYNLVAKEIGILLKTQEFRFVGMSAKLSRPSAFPNEILPIVSKMFEQIFRTGEYRATEAFLYNLQADTSVQKSLFEPALRLESLSRLYNYVDQVNSKYGKAALHLLTSHKARVTEQFEGDRGDKPARKDNLLKGENKRQRVNLPILNLKGV